MGDLLHDFQTCPFRTKSRWREVPRMAMQTKRSDPASKLLFSHPRVAADLIRLLG